MKAKLAALDVKRQIGLVAGGLLLVLVIAHFLVLSPKKGEASSLRTQVEDLQAQIAALKLEESRARKPQALDTASVFRLAKAIPDRDDMPGVVLALVEVARESGIQYELVEPQERIVLAGGTLDARRLHVVVRGNFATLSAFIGRLQGLVTLQNGEVEARGRLFNVEGVDLARDETGAAPMRADIHLKAYVTAEGPTAAEVAAAEAAAAPPPTEGAAG
jgi:Tfp pilus assembly protein PilO